MNHEKNREDESSGPILEHCIKDEAEVMIQKLQQIISEYEKEKVHHDLVCKKNTEEKESYITYIHQSRSWKVTSPMRWMYRNASAFVEHFLFHKKR